MENNATNSSSNPIPVSWTFSPIFTLALEILVILLNGSLLVLFLTKASLRISTFHVYIMNVTFANFIHAILVDPFSIITDLHQSTWIFSYSLCSLYQFSLWILSSAMQNAHALITLNRLWAIVFPISYRQSHTRKTALLLCSGMWISIFIVLLPGMIPDALYYRRSLEKGACRVNTMAQRDWSVITHFVAYGLAECIIIAAYPFIICAHYRRKKVGITSGPSTAVRAVTSAHVTTPANAPRKRPSHSVHILTLLTISVFICWTPGSVVYSILPFKDVEIPLFADLLFAVQAALDPVLFTITMPELNQAMRRFWKEKITAHAVSG